MWFPTSSVRPYIKMSPLKIWLGGTLGEIRYLGVLQSKNKRCYQICYQYSFFSLCTLSIVATQMWCLARLLPLMIGNSVPEGDPNWDNFLLLLKIADYILSPITSQSIAALLTTLIEDYLSRSRSSIRSVQSFQNSITWCTYHSG